MVLYVVAGCTAVGLLAAMYDVGYKEITWKEFSNRSVGWLYTAAAATDIGT